MAVLHSKFPCNCKFLFINGIVQYIVGGYSDDNNNNNNNNDDGDDEGWWC